jgi:DUF4097 and DUF4098 domain-containing protein YvlB
MRITPVLLLAALAAGAAPAVASDAVDRAAVREVAHAARTGAYQGRDRGPEQTDRFTRKVKLGRDGRVSISNISGNIVVTGGSGDEVTIDAVKRARGDQGQIANVRIVVDDRPGRVDIRTEYDSGRFMRNNNNVSVDYTITVPAGASVEAKSVSGNIKVTAVRGAVRSESVSGDVTTSDTPKVETAKSVSGNVTLSGIQNDGDLAASSVSGTVTAKGVRAHALDLGSVSGDVMVSDVTCDRLNAKSVSGGFEYTGSIAKGGVYDVNLHSGTVRFVLVNPTGFELTANTFSGNIRSDLPLTIGGDRDANRDRDRDNGRRRGENNRAMRATFGDGSATLTLHTFSGDIVITKR